MQKQYHNQREELTGKKGDYEKIYQKYKQAMGEKNDLENEMHREREDLLDRIRELTKEIRLKHLIIDNFIPANEYMKIEQGAQWFEDVKEWTVPSIEFTGNNIKINKNKKKKGEKIDQDLENNFLYEHILNFNDDEEEEDYKSAATDRVQSMISNIMMEEAQFGEAEEDIPQPAPTATPSVYYKYTDTGAEREDPEALEKKKKKGKGKSKSGARPLTAKKMKKGDIVNMVQTMTSSQDVAKTEKEAKKKKMNFPQAKGLIKE